MEILGRWSSTENKHENELREHGHCDEIATHDLKIFFTIWSFLNTTLTECPNLVRSENKLLPSVIIVIREFLPV